MKGVMNMSFGKILKELRTERKVTQQELSDYLDISKSMISMYESNQRKPSYEMLEAIADFFNVDMNRLYGAPSNAYYIDPAVNAKAEYARAQEGILLDAAKDLSDEDLDYVVDLVKRLRGK